MYCSSCGSLIKDGQSFCANCGAPVTPAVQPAPQPAVQQVQPAQPLYQQPVTQVTVAPAAVPAAPAKKDKYSRLSKKRVRTAGILGIIVGSFGVHNFIMKQPVRGILHILLFFLPLLPVLLLFIDILTSGGVSDLGIGLEPTSEFMWMLPSYASWLWGLIEGIILLATSSKYHGDKK